MAISFIFGIYYLIVKYKPQEKLLVNVSWNIPNELNLEIEELNLMIDPLIKDQYLIDYEKIKDILQKIDSVDEALVDRSNISDLIISLKSKKPIYRWRDINICDEKVAICNGYISSSMKLFRGNDVTNELPMIISDRKNVADYVATFKTYQSSLDGEKITTFKKSKIDIITLNNNKKIILGNEKQLERLNLYKKVSKLKEVKKKIRKRPVFDMRYSNGFSLSHSE
ncbi:cell division protein FtsQ [Gammaproteobacteria bacterium]|nr:cell division protein FtsQ [Gammaproteobacteria bacterium]